MLMVRIFYVEKKTKQVCYRQNRAELLACIIVNQDQDVWCFAFSVQCPFPLFLALVVLIGYLCPLMGLLYVNIHLCFPCPSQKMSLRHIYTEHGIVSKNSEG